MLILIVWQTSLAEDRYLHGLVDSLNKLNLRLLRTLFEKVGEGPNQSS